MRNQASRTLAETNESINPGTPAFHHLSWTDPVGRLFWRDGELYRGIRQQYSTFHADLFAKGVIQEVVAKHLLVDTSPTDWTTAEFPLIVEHRVLPVVSFASEWCASQIKAVALAILDLEIALRPHGVTVQDINPWNVLFDGWRPLFVDYGSITPLVNKHIWDAESLFNEFYLNPLLLFERGLGRVARRLLCDPWVGVRDADVQRMGLLPRPHRSARTIAVTTARRVAKTAVLRPLQSKVKQVAQGLRSLERKAQERGDALPHITALRDRVAAMPTGGSPTPWDGYYQNNFPEFTPSGKWTSKHKSIHSIIEQTRPKSLLDVGSNRGWYSQMAASRGVRVIAADSDESAVNELYANTVAAQLPIHTVFMDVRFPEPAQGPAYKFFDAATQRFRSEMVLALAVVHHLAFTWHLSFDQIIENFDGFSSRWLAIEFVGPNDGVVKRLWKNINYPWYTLDNFIACLQRRYVILNQFPSDSGGLDIGADMGPDDRVVLLCEKRVPARQQEH